MERWDEVGLADYPCDLCGRSDSRAVLYKQGRLIRKRFRVVQCRGCGHVWVSPRVPDEHIADLYDADYYDGRGFDATVNYRESAQNDYRNSPIVQAIAQTVGQLFRAGSHPRVLDIGCGLGDLVLGLRDRGFDAVGFDASPAARRVIAERDVPALEDLDTAPQRYHGAFDLVTAVEVIEHVTTPKSFLAFLRRLVRAGGFVFILTGNWKVQRRVPRTPYVMPEGHIHYFTPSTLKKFFAAAGLEATQVPYNAAWYANRMLPRHVPVPLRRVLQRAAQTVAPDLGPLPIGRRPERD